MWLFFTGQHWQQFSIRQWRVVQWLFTLTLVLDSGVTTGHFDLLVTSHWSCFWQQGEEQHLDLLVMSPWPWLQAVGWQNCILTYLWCHPDPGCRQYGDRTGHFEPLVMSPWPSRVIEQGTMTYLWCHPDSSCKERGDRTGHCGLLVTSPWPWL